ncbi:MAG TPA: cytochrome b/b6 domain-containing protein [Rudaea sp.]|nr:cytochrome b/b6 domain-containing protein [Rudaea sp.]
MNSIVQRVWDLPTRLFHWTLVVLIALQYATGEFNLLDMRWHFWFGYATLALIVFRVLWGFFGSQTSRFSDFLRGPRAVLRYLRDSMSTNPQARVGHNPLGGWSVLALLASVAAQAVSGLFSSDDIDTDGPLVAHVSDATVKLMTRVHHWNENVLLALVCLHVAAVLLYLIVKHDNLIAPMIQGFKRAPSAQSLRFSSSWLALLLFVLCAGAVGMLVWWAG